MLLYSINSEATSHKSTSSFQSLYKAGGEQELPSAHPDLQVGTQRVTKLTKTLPFHMVPPLPPLEDHGVKRQSNWSPPSLTDVF